MKESASPLRCDKLNKCVTKHAKARYKYKIKQ